MPDCYFTEDEKKQVYANSKKYFGTTQLCSAGGYILPDGTLLDFRNDVAKTLGQRSRRLEHEEIRWPIMKAGCQIKSNPRNVAIEELGLVRFHQTPSFMSLEMSELPNPEQIKRIEECLVQLEPKAEIFFDIYKRPYADSSRKNVIGDTISLQSNPRAALRKLVRELRRAREDLEFIV